MAKKYDFPISLSKEAQSKTCKNGVEKKRKTPVVQEFEETKLKKSRRK